MRKKDTFSKKQLNPQKWNLRRITKMEDLNLVWSREANESILKSSVILWTQWEAASCLCNFAWVKTGKRDRLFFFGRSCPSVFLRWKSFLVWQMNVPSFCTQHFFHRFFWFNELFHVRQRKNSQSKWPSFCTLQVDSLLGVQPRDLRGALEAADGAHQPPRPHHGHCLLQPPGIHLIGNGQPRLSFRTTWIGFYELCMQNRNRITWCGLTCYASLILFRLIWYRVMNK